MKVASFQIPELHGYSVAFSPLVPDLLACAVCENYGIAGSGYLFVLQQTYESGFRIEAKLPWPDGIFDVTWSEVDVNLLATCSGDGSIQLWNLLTTENPTVVLFGHTKEVYGVNWCPGVSDPFLLSASWDETIKLWDILSGVELTKLTTMGSTSSTVAPLAAPPGPPRAIMAPPPSTQQTQQFQATTVSTQSPWNGATQKPGIQTVRTVAPTSTPVMTSVLPPPPGLSAMSATLTQTPWQSQPFPTPQVQQTTVLTTQGITPVASMMAPPPPPPSLTGGTQPQAALQTAQPVTTWMTQPTLTQAAIPPTPWQMPPQQIMASTPMPVPPPPGVALPPPPTITSMYPWTGFVGVPPPPPLQASLQTLATAPPPPPPSSSVQASCTTSSITQSVDLTSLALPNLLTAPPPPPPS